MCCNFGFLFIVKQEGGTKESYKTILDSVPIEKKIYHFLKCTWNIHEN